MTRHWPAVRVAARTEKRRRRRVHTHQPIHLRWQTALQRGHRHQGLWQDGDTAAQDTPVAASPASEPVDENLAIIARQAIVNENREVYGYELFDRSTASDSRTAASDAALLFNALSYAGAEILVGKK